LIAAGTSFVTAGLPVVADGVLAELVLDEEELLLLLLLPHAAITPTHTSAAGTATNLFDTCILKLLSRRRARRIRDPAARERNL
jgi:hypothetical protein